MFDPGYIGTMALEEINKEEVIINVPNSAMINSKLSDCFELEKIFVNHSEYFSIPNREHEDYRMLGFLLFELSKGPHSQWFDYFQALPENPETITE